MRRALRAFASSGGGDVVFKHSFSTPGMLYEGDVLRVAFGLESWFCLPEQGMMQYEILSRGSAFLTPWRSDATRLHVVAPAHVTHPWKFRHFAALAGPELDWLDAVREEAVRVVLSVREPGSGRVLAQVRLQPGGKLHPDGVDLAVFGLVDEEAQLGALEAAGLGALPLQLAEAGEDGGSAVLVGHELRGEEALLPCALNGELAGRDGGVAAVRTLGAVSQMGLCGGPALQPGPDGARACGMVFARVDAPGPLRDHTLLVTAAAINDFLRSHVEKM
jgi:hypothetical protein